MKKLCVWAVAALLMAACTPKAEKAVRNLKDRRGDLYEVKMKR